MGLLAAGTSWCPTRVAALFGSLAVGGLESTTGPQESECLSHRCPKSGECLVARHEKDRASYREDIAGQLRLSSVEPNHPPQVATEECPEYTGDQRRKPPARGLLARQQARHRTHPETGQYEYDDVHSSTPIHLGGAPGHSSAPGVGTTGNAEPCDPGRLRVRAADSGVTTRSAGALTHASSLFGKHEACQEPTGIARMPPAFKSAPEPAGRSAPSRTVRLSLVSQDRRLRRSVG
jgi:hypothetical protein